MVERPGWATRPTCTREGPRSHSRSGLGPLYPLNLLPAAPASRGLGARIAPLFFHPCRWLWDPEDGGCGPQLRGRWGTSPREINLLADFNPPLEQKIKEEAGKMKPELLRICKGRRGMFVFFSPSFWKVLLTNASCGCLASKPSQSTLILGKAWNKCSPFPPS